MTQSGVCMIGRGHHVSVSGELFRECDGLNAAAEVAVGEDDQRNGAAARRGRGRVKSDQTGKGRCIGILRRPSVRGVPDGNLPAANLHDAIAAPEVQFRETAVNGSSGPDDDTDPDSQSSKGAGDRSEVGAAEPRTSRFDRRRPTSKGR